MKHTRIFEQVKEYFNDKKYIFQHFLSLFFSPLVENVATNQQHYIK